MIIGGLQKFSILDYPEHLAAVIFTQGCNFRCQFCYNPKLVLSKTADTIHHTTPEIKNTNKVHSQTSFKLLKEQENGLFNFLESRKNKLEAVVITGGEPTLHCDLPEFIKKIKKLNYKIKLDTNGTNPKMLTQLINERLIDYIAMDIKGPLLKYLLITNRKIDLNKIKESIIIIKNSHLPYEFRTTIAPNLITEDDIEEMGLMLLGSEKWYLQQFKSGIELVSKNFSKQAPYPLKDLKKMQKMGSKYVKKCEIR